MARYEVRVQLLDVDETNASEARNAVENRLREAGFARWRILAMRPQGMPYPARRRRPRRRSPRRDQMVGGSLLVGSLIAWWLWFYVSLSPE